LSEFRGKTIFSDIVLKQIKEHLNYDTSGKEIYGWLLGFSDNSDVWVITSLPCFNYDIQTIVGARPTPEEIDILTSCLPQGIGVVGIYHSHPNQVFHSQTDDQMLLGYAATNNNFISLVTNRKDDVKVFRIVDPKSKKIDSIFHKPGKIPNLRDLKFLLKMKGFAEIDAEFQQQSFNRITIEYIERLFENSVIVTKKERITEGIRIEKIKSVLIEIETEKKIKLKDENSKNTTKINFDLEIEQLGLFYGEKILTKGLINSIKIALIDTCMRKISLGDIIKGILIPANERIIDYLGIGMRVIYSKKSNEQSKKFVQSLVAKSELLIKLEEKELAIKLLKSCKDYFQDLNDNKEKLKVEKILNKI